MKPIGYTRNGHSLTCFEFSRVVRQLAAIQGKTMNDLLPYAQCSKTTLSKIWNGKKCNPTIGTVNGILKALD